MNDDFALNAGSGMLLHESPQTHLAAFVQRSGEFSLVSLMGGIVGERLFQKREHVEGRKPGPIILSARIHRQHWRSPGNRLDRRWMSII